MTARRAYTDDEVEAAVQALSDPARLEQAQRVVEANAPALQRILNVALDEANWFDAAHQQQVLEAAGKADIEDRLGGGPGAARRGDARRDADRRRRRLRTGPRADRQGGALMPANVRWLGHSAFHLSGGGADVLVDPFLTGNPKAAAYRRRARRPT